MMTDITHLVRERAYYIWEETGRPEGLEKEHWLMAEREVAEKVANESSYNGRDARSADHPDEVNWDGAKTYNRDLKEFENTGEVRSDKSQGKQLRP